MTSSHVTGAGCQLASGEVRDPSVGPSVRFLLLGPVSVEVAGRPIELGGIRQVRLLTMLLLSAGVPVPSDRIVEALWKRPPKSARQQVYNAVNGLRRTFADVTGVRVDRSEVGYVLHAPSLAVDVDRFRAGIAAADDCLADGDVAGCLTHLRAAVGLWRGPALSGVAAGSRPLEIIARRLDEERTSVAERLVTVARRPGGTTAGVGRSTAGPAQRAEDGGEGRAPVASDPVPPTGPETVQGIPATNYLPRDSNEFTGRMREIQELIDATTPTTALAILTIDGIGGIGKTALAVRVAHQLADRYPDGQFFVDLLGFTAGAEPLTREQALGHLLRQSGVPGDSVPPGVSERSGLWRTRLAGKRALVLLDNAADEAQVRDLLPGTADSLVLVTSRRRFTALDGAVPFPLDILPRADAIDLFVRIAGAHRVNRESADAAEVVDLCGRQPHAVRTAAARFRDRDSWTLTELLGQLRTRRRRTRFLAVGDQNVMSRLAASYQRLTTAQRRLFRLLGLHPVAEFDAAAAAALAGMPLDDVEECLEALYEGNLLLRPTADRFILQRLLRDCALDLLSRHDSQETQRKATHRILDYYLYIAHAWCRPDAVGVFRFEVEVVNPPRTAGIPTDDVDRMRLIRANERSMVAAAHSAAARGWHDHAWRIPCAMMPFLALGNYAADSYPLFHLALAAASERRDAEGEMRSVAAMAFVARDREKDADRARQLFEQAIGIAIRMPDLGARAYLVADLGVSLRGAGRLREAQRTLAEAYDMAVTVDDRWLVAAAETSLGVIHSELGQYPGALRHLERAAAAGAGVISIRAGLLIDLNVGLVRVFQGQVDEACAIFDRTVAGARRAGSLTVEAWAHSLRSVARRSLGDARSAMMDARHALNLARVLHQPEVEGDALNALGEAFLAVPDLAEAETSFQQADALAEKFRIRFLRARAVEGRAHVLRAAGDAPGAGVLWEQALSLHPAEAVAAQHVRAHLDRLEQNDITCPRCRTADQHSSAPDPHRQPDVPGVEGDGRR